MHIVGVGCRGNGLEELRFGEQVLRSGQNARLWSPFDCSTLKRYGTVKLFQNMGSLVSCCH